MNQKVVQFIAGACVAVPDEYEVQISVSWEQVPDLAISSRVVQIFVRCPEKRKLVAREVQELDIQENTMAPTDHGRYLATSCCKELAES